jgi:hypothetical protein
MDFGLCCRHLAGFFFPVTRDFFPANMQAGSCFLGGRVRAWRARRVSADPSIFSRNWHPGLARRRSREPSPRQPANRRSMRCSSRKPFRLLPGSSEKILPRKPPGFPRRVSGAAQDPAERSSFFEAGEIARIPVWAGKRGIRRQSKFWPYFTVILILRLRYSREGDDTFIVDLLRRNISELSLPPRTISEGARCLCRFLYGYYSLKILPTTRIC